MWEIWVMYKNKKYEWYIKLSIGVQQKKQPWILWKQDILDICAETCITKRESKRFKVTRL